MFLALNIAAIVPTMPEGTFDFAMHFPVNQAMVLPEDVSHGIAPSRIG